MTSQNSFDFSKYKYLNVGGGNFSHRDDGWLNLDYPFESQARKRDWNLIDIKHDLMFLIPLPIPADTLEAVYTEHLIEHLPEKMVEHLLNEVNRILKPGGWFRISCPNASVFVDILRSKCSFEDQLPGQWCPSKTNSREDIFIDALCTTLRTEYLPKNYIQALGKGYDWDLKKMMRRLEMFVPPIMHQQQTKRPGDHLSWWDYERLCSYTRDAGFNTISEPLKINQSQCEAFKASYIDQTCPACSLRVECQK